jgi:hypothetical protein
MEQRAEAFMDAFIQEFPSSLEVLRAHYADEEIPPDILSGKESVPIPLDAVKRMFQAVIRRMVKEQAQPQTILLLFLNILSKETGSDITVATAPVDHDTNVVRH